MGTIVVMWPVMPKKVENLLLRQGRKHWYYKASRQGNEAVEEEERDIVTTEYTYIYKIKLSHGIR